MKSNKYYVIKGLIAILIGILIAIVGEPAKHIGLPFFIGMAICCYGGINIGHGISPLSHSSYKFHTYDLENILDSFYVMREKLQKIQNLEPEKRQRYINTWSIGLCSMCFNLAMTDKIEYDAKDVTRVYIKLNRPCSFSSWSAFVNTFSAYYWPIHDIQSRIKWLDKHISKLEKRLS
jgi:hypothetical protein